MEVEGVRSADRVGCFRNPSEREGKKNKNKNQTTKRTAH